MQTMIFAVGAREYALDVTAIVEVVRMVALTTLPDAPDWLAGVVNLRGHVIAVMDLRRRLALPALAPHRNTPIIIAQAAGEQFGIIVDRLVEVIDLPGASVEQITGALPAHFAVHRLAHLDQRVVMVLDTTQLAAAMPTIR